MAITQPSGGILALNSGSSSLKVAVFGWKGDQPLLTASASGIGADGGGRLVVHGQGGETLSEEAHMAGDQMAALAAVVQAIGKHHEGAPEAVGHRLVHGGMHLVEHQRITPAVMQQLEGAVHFAPLHIPASLQLIRKAQELFPQAAQFACFDTAFHQTMPEREWRLPIPDKYTDAGVRRYGFHGLSYESIVAQLRDRGALPSKLIVAHLGGGSSVCAMESGRSQATTMGLTPAGGIPSATRTGDLDPGVLTFLGRTAGLSADDLEHMVNHDCGLRALAGGPSDMQELEKLATGSGAEASRARLAIEVFAEAVARTVAGYAVVLGGVDMLVLTGGIGEHSQSFREAVARLLAPLHLLGDDQAASIRVLPAQEELQIARHVRRLKGEENRG